MPAAGSVRRGRLVELPPSQHDPAEVRETADEILARSEYDWREPSENPLEEAARQIAEWLGDLVGGGSAGGGGGGSLPVWVGYLVLAALVALVVFLVWRARAGLRPQARPSRAEAAVVVAPGEEVVDWASEADRHETAGRWRDGLRCRYRALAGTLADRAVIADLVGRTAGEYVTEVRAACPPVAEDFAAATDLFERAWYGGEDTGQDDRDRFAGLATRVLTDARPGTAGDGAGERPLVAPT